MPDRQEFASGAGRIEAEYSPRNPVKPARLGTVETVINARFRGHGSGEPCRLASCITKKRTPEFGGRSAARVVPSSSSMSTSSAHPTWHYSIVFHPFTQNHFGRFEMLTRFITNYVARHQNRANQVLHLVGVPLTFVCSIILLIQQRPEWAAAAFVGGYILQFIGHTIEGNDAGELIVIKRMLGKPYQEFAPGYEEQSKSAD